MLTPVEVRVETPLPLPVSVPVPVGVPGVAVPAPEPVPLVEPLDLVNDIVFVLRRRGSVRVYSALIINAE